MSERNPSREEPEETGEEYPAGTEVPADPPGVGEGIEEEDQPGLAEDPPQAD